METITNIILTFSDVQAVLAVSSSNGGSADDSSSFPCDNNSLANVMALS